MKTKLFRIDKKEYEYVREVLDTQFSSSAGAVMMKKLEEKFAHVFGVKYAIPFINGTATMHAALAAAGVGSGDEVIVPPLTMASTSFAVLHANAIPVFADIHPDMWTINPESIEARITPQTKAIIPVSVYGLSPDMDPIMDIAEKYDLLVVEDDAECFLGYYKGRVVGSIGHASSFSFQSSKHMTSGEGGMITTNNEEYATEIRRFGSLGYAALGADKGKITKDDIQNPQYNRHSSVGWNYRLPELCAAVALAQLERLEELVEMRKSIAKLYLEAVEGCDWLVQQLVPEGYIHSYWTFVLKLENEGEFSWYDFRKKYMELGGDGIYAAWQLTYLEPAFYEQAFASTQSQQYQRELCPVAENVQPKLFQFKTNYMDIAVAEQKAEALGKTIRYFEGRK